MRRTFVPSERQGDPPLLVYVNGFGNVMDVVDQGCTLTMVLLLDGVAYVANAGDSDVYLYERSKSARSERPYRATRVTAEHSIKSASERDRVVGSSRGAISVSGRYFKMSRAS